MDNLVEQVASLRRETMQRHNDNVERADVRHGEVMTRLERIEDRQTEAHGKMSALEATIKYLQEEWALIRKRYHELVNAKQAVTGENAVVTRLDAKSAVAIFMLGMAMITAILKLTGKL